MSILCFPNLTADFDCAGSIVQTAIINHRKRGILCAEEAEGTADRGWTDDPLHGPGFSR